MGFGSLFDSNSQSEALGQNPNISGTTGVAGQALYNPIVLQKSKIIGSNSLLGKSKNSALTVAGNVLQASGGSTIVTSSTNNYSDDHSFRPSVSVLSGSPGASSDLTGASSGTGINTKQILIIAAIILAAVWFLRRN